MTENKVDLSEFNLLIATPMADGRPEDIYNSSLDKTKQIIRLHDGQVECFKTKYISDISFARSKLFGAFLRNKQYTHMLMIDADQGWEAEDVIWMLLLQRDLIAGVSPKKCFPIEYAFNMNGDDGKPELLYHEMETNVADVPFVGCAFMMVSRACIEKMAESYEDLQYDAPDGQVEYSVFDPVILNANNGTPRRRLSEDYAFCWRWRKIGGKVKIKMDIKLQHAGTHIFSGSLLDHLCQKQDIENGEKC